MTLSDSFKTLSEILLTYSLEHEYSVGPDEFKQVIEKSISDNFNVQFCYSKEFEGFFDSAYKSNRQENTLP